MRPRGGSAWAPPHKNNSVLLNVSEECKSSILESSLIVSDLVSHLAPFTISSHVFHV